MRSSGKIFDRMDRIYKMGSGARFILIILFILSDASGCQREEKKQRRESFKDGREQLPRDKIRRGQKAEHDDEADQNHSAATRIWLCLCSFQLAHLQFDGM